MDFKRLKTQEFGERSFEYCSFTPNCMKNMILAFEDFFSEKIRLISFFSIYVSVLLLIADKIWAKIAVLLFYGGSQNF